MPPEIRNQIYTNVLVSGEFIFLQAFGRSGIKNHYILPIRITFLPLSAREIPWEGLNYNEE